jgi:hypothetical protein
VRVPGWYCVVRDSEYAVLIGPQDPADVEDAATLAQYLAEKADGSLRTIPHREAAARLGLSRLPPT